MLPAVLSAIRRDLERVVLPEVQSAEARDAAVRMCELLAYLTVWRRDLVAQAGPLTSAQSDALGRLQAITGDDAVSQAGPPPLADVLARLPDYARLLQALDAQVAVLADRAFDPEVAEACSRAVGADLMLFDREASLLGAEREQAAARMAATSPRLLPQTLTAYARDVFPADQGASVSVLRSQGLQGERDDFQLELVSGIGRRMDLTLRRDGKAARPGFGVGEESRLLRILHAAGFPVAEPVWHEADASVAGRPFMLSLAVAGSRDVATWSADEDTRIDVPLSLARVLGRLHSLDDRVVHAAGFGRDRDPETSLGAMIGRLRDHWLAVRLYPSPTLQAAFGWLIAQAADAPAPSALVHGNPVAARLVVASGGLAALEGWEQARLGHPAEDLAICRLWTHELLPWSDFVDAYESAGGRAPTGDEHEFWALWRDVQGAVSAVQAWRTFADGENPALEAAYTGMTGYRRSLQQVAARLRRLWYRDPAARPLDPVERTLP
jgi:aminoglycoside phosphotransferase (APT) family kinase protein